jgi:hypothetical protein
VSDCLARLGLISSLGLAAVLAACSTASPTGPSTTGAALTPDPTPTTGAPSGTLGPPPSPTPPDESSPLAIDPALLEVLPADVAGFPVTESLEEATLAIGNSALQAIASAVDAAVAVDTASGNVVYALVVQLRSDVFDDDAYRRWRDAYDQGACAAGGLVIGNLEAEIDGRAVHIGTCEGGFRTYHVLLTAQAVLISAWSLGEGGFGELLVSSLRVEEP